MTRVLKSVVDQIDSISRPYGYEDVKEELTSVPCEIEGCLPTYLSGTLYRQAGGAFHDDATLLDGLAHVVGWKIKDQKVSFSNKFVRSEAYHALQSGARGWENTVTHKKVDSKLLKKAGKEGITSGNMNVNIWLLGENKIAAASEFPEGEVIVMDSETLGNQKQLKTLPGKQVFDKKNGKVFTTCAHYLYEPTQEGDYHIATYLKAISPDNTFEAGYTIFKGRSEFPMKPFTTFPLQQFNWLSRKSAPLSCRPSYMHSMAVCSDYLIGICTSKKLNFDRLSGGDVAFFEMYEFKDTPVEFIIWDKKTGEVVEKDLKGESPGMIFHISNSFNDTNRNITMDMSFSDCDSLVTKPVVSGIIRYEIDLKKKIVKQKILSNRIFEFPCCNPRLLESKYNYLYGVTNPDQWGISKIDLTSGHHFDWECSSDWTASEPVFVKNPSSMIEDDGILLVPSINICKKQSIVAVLDAHTMKLIAKIINPITVNFGLHNLFVPDNITTFVKL